MKPAAREMEVNFGAPPTVAEFLDSNAFVRVVVGPVGSGKSPAGAGAEAIARRHPPHQVRHHPQHLLPAPGHHPEDVRAMGARRAG